MTTRKYIPEHRFWTYHKVPDCTYEPTDYDLMCPECGGYIQDTLWQRDFLGG